VYKFKKKFRSKKQLSDYFILYGLSAFFFLLLFVAVVSSFKNDVFKKEILIDKNEVVKQNIEKSHCNGFIYVNKVTYEYGYPSMTDILFFDGEIKSSIFSRISFLNFSVDNNSISYLQLYVDGKFITETPVFEGKAHFEHLNFSISDKKFVVISHYLGIVLVLWGNKLGTHLGSQWINHVWIC